MGAIGLQKVLLQLEENSVIAEKQDETRVTYAAKLEKSEAKLDWSLSAIELDRKVRGLNSWPVAHTLCNAIVLRIWKAKIADGGDLPPGTVSVQGKKMIVATGDGVLEILEVQVPGRKRMSVEAFLNAHDVDGIIMGK
jgi:methionyl-tRNA formyltransferase